MRKLSFIPVFLSLAALSAGGANASSAFTPSLVAVSDTLIGTPSYAGHDAFAKAKAKNPDAKKRGFCPPGQAKKPGRGSAFNC